MFEIDDQTNTQFGDAKIIHHLTSFMVSNLVYDFGVHNHRAKNDQVGNELADLNAAKENRKPSLLVKENVVLFKQYGQRVLVNFLVEAMPNLVKHLESEADDFFEFLP